MDTVMAIDTADQSTKENTAITVVIATIALGLTTEGIGPTENTVVIGITVAIGTIALTGHTTGVITAINTFC
ncbi:hypothetical protein [Advenella kashmirensis]|nr:hypothetical protein [Advenella kashmirensis]